MCCCNNNWGYNKNQHQGFDCCKKEERPEFICKCFKKEEKKPCCCEEQNKNYGCSSNMNYNYNWK